jgi:hypothetical protein
MDIQELQSLRDKMAEVERQVIEDITAKALLLGMKLVPIDETAPMAPKQKRKRRTKEALEADKARMLRNEL